MYLKLFLNKVVKVDNIENYSLDSLIKLQDEYENFLEKSEGYDPDFPMIGLGVNNKKGKKSMKVKGTNAFALFDEDNPDPNYEGIKRSAIAKAKKKTGEVDKLS
jgi:hypothetical protein